MPHFHRPEETLHASSLFAEPGGKGYNQAVAAARMGAKTAFAGAIGQEIGKAISISSWSSHSSPQPRLYKSRAMVTEEGADNAMGGHAPAIPVSKLTYQVNVNVRFELK